MPTERKIAQVAELEDRLNRAIITIGLDYRGLKVGQLRNLRLALREAEPRIEVRVVKNTLLRRAAAHTGKDGVAAITQEATALVFGFDDAVAPARALTRYLRTSRLNVPLRGAYLEGAVLTPAQVGELAETPSRPELMAKMAGGLNSPISGIAGSLQAIIRSVAAIVAARAQQLEQGGA